MEDNARTPVLRTEQIHGCLRALGPPEPELLPWAAALGALPLWVKASAPGADRLDQQQQLRDARS
ncbi:hypothetical protein [Streptomyces sp. NPDC003032]